MSTAKRVYFYLVYTITVGLFAGGAGVLLDVIFDLIFKSGTIQVGGSVFSRQTLSLGLAMLVIGGVLWFLFWRAIKRNVGTDTVEIGAAIRKLFLNVITGAAALVTVFGAVDLLAHAMTGSLAQFSSDGLARVIVGGLDWYYHWRLSETEGPPSPAAQTRRRGQVFSLCGWGVVAFTVNLVAFISMAVNALPVWGQTIAAGPFWNASLRFARAWTGVAGLLWGFYWLRMAKGDFESTLRQVYLWLLCVVGGAIAGLVGLTTALWRVFGFVFGARSADYFRFLGWTVPLMLLGFAIWYYHRRVTDEEAAKVLERRLSARRVHFYIMSFISLATSVTGLILLFGVLLDLLIYAVNGQTTVVTAGWWRGPLGGCIALLIVAVPLWLFYWDRVLQIAASGGVAERTARSRRIFLYVLLGAPIIALAADMVNIVYQVLNGLLNGTLGVGVLHSMKWSLQTLFIAAPLLWYFWGVVRQDQRLGAEAAVRKTVTLVLPEAAAESVTRLEEKLGYRVKAVYYLQGEAAQPPATDEELARLAAAIQAAPGEKVMLQLGGGEAKLAAYREK